MLEILFDRALIEIAQRAATARGPIEKIADQVKAPPCAMASPPVFDETRCVAFDMLSVEPTLQASKQSAPPQVFFRNHHPVLHC
jgi:hypothetical protein